MKEDRMLEKLAKSIVEGDTEVATAAVKKAISAGIDPLVAIEKGLNVGMKEVGDKFEAGEIPLPYVLVSAEAMMAAVDLLVKNMSKEKTPKPRGVVVIGTVKGDIHSIGKDIVKALMSANGFLVYDLGVDVTVEKFIDEAQKVKADIIGASAFLTTTAIQYKLLIKTLTERGMRDKYKVMIGGAVASQSFCDDIKADAYGKNATSAVEIAKELLNQGV